MRPSKSRPVSEKSWFIVKNYINESLKMIPEALSLELTVLISTEDRPIKLLPEVADELIPETSIFSTTTSLIKSILIK